MLLRSTSKYWIAIALLGTQVPSAQSYQFDSKYGHVGMLVSTDRTADVAPIKVRLPIDVAYLLDGATAGYVSPGTLPDYPHQMGVDFAGNFIVVEGATAKLYRLGHETRGGKQRSKEASDWSKYYAALQKTIGLSWRCKSQGQCILAIEIGKNGSLKVIETIQCLPTDKSPNFDSTRFLKAIGESLSVVKEISTPFPNTRTDGFVFAAKFASGNSQAISKMPVKRFPFLAVGALLAAGFELERMDYRRLAQRLYEKSDELLSSAKPSRSIEFAKAELALSKNRNSDKIASRSKEVRPVVDQFIEEELNMRLIKLLGASDYDGIAVFADTLAYDVRTLDDQEKLTQEILTSLIQTYSVSDEEQLPSFFAFCDRLKSALQRDDLLDTCIYRNTYRFQIGTRLKIMLTERMPESIKAEAARRLDEIQNTQAPKTAARPPRPAFLQNSQTFERHPDLRMMFAQNSQQPCKLCKNRIRKY